MYLNELCKIYTPSFPGFVVAHVIPFFFPKIGPFLKVWYHSKELYNNIEHTLSHVRIVDLYFPHEEEITTVGLIPHLNFAALISNTWGFSSALTDLSNMKYNIDNYIKCSRLEIEGNDPISSIKFISSFVLSCLSALAGSLSFIENAQYTAYNCNTKELIDPLLMTNLGTKIVRIYDPYGENSELEPSALLTEEGNIENIETITNLSS